MKKLYLIALVLLAMLVARSAYAALGLPKNTAKLGYATGTVYVSVDDPAGNTAKKWTPLPLTLIHTNWLIKDIRYWSELFYYKATLDPAANRVGQNVEQFGLRVSLQKSLRLTRLWAPWLGMGVGVSRVTYDTRHTVDSDGFLLAAWPDREQTSVVLLFNIVSEWPLTRNWDIGVKLEQAIPVDGDINESSALIMLLYRY
ncbi:MAG: hypothetical protein GXP18_05355 [Gammaproteobacteria bacterium]|nr:hypothetical protein [Gammaproteobacteria bacterium]